MLFVIFGSLVLLFKIFAVTYEAVPCHSLATLGIGLFTGLRKLLVVADFCSQCQGGLCNTF